MKTLHFIHLLGIVLLIWLVSNLDLVEFKRVLMDASVPYILLGLLVSAPVTALKIWRQQISLRIFGLDTKIFWNWRVFNIANLFAMSTPGRIGEVTRITFFTKQGLSLNKASQVFLGEKLFELSILGLVTLCLIPILFISPFSSKLFSNGMPKVVILGVFCAILAALLLVRIFAFEQFFRVISRIRNQTIIAVIKGTWHYSLTIYLLNCLQVLLLAFAFGIRCNPLLLILCYGIGAIVSSLPISISGLGTREAVFLALLSDNTNSTSSVFALSITDGLISPVITLLISQLLYFSIFSVSKLWSFRPQKFRP